MAVISPLQTKPKVYVLDPYHEDAIRLLESEPGIHIVLPSDPLKGDFHKDATALLVRSETHLTSGDFEKANPTLKYVVKQGVGVDNIDVQAATAHGIRVYNTPGLNGEAVAELTLSLALGVSRRVCEIDRYIHNGKRVVRSQTLGRSLYKKTIGLIGMGNIGLFVARKWIGVMEGNVIAYDPYARDGAWEDTLTKETFCRVSTLNELLAAADVVSLHVPLTGSTRNMIGAKEFDLMKQDAILINCSRGGIVDESALLNALQTGKLFGAGLDALSIEPPTIEAYGNTLMSCPNVIITPHIGASSVENQSRSGIASVTTLLELLRGQEPALGRLS